VPKSHLRLAKNPDYWGKPLPYIDRVTFKVLEEEDARVADTAQQQHGRPFTTTQAEGVDDQRLAAARLTGQQVEAGLEANAGALDQRQVAHMELLQRGRFSSG